MVLIFSWLLLIYENSFRTKDRSRYFPADLEGHLPFCQVATCTCLFGWCLRSPKPLQSKWTTFEFYWFLLIIFKRRRRSIKCQNRGFYKFDQLLGMCDSVKTLENSILHIWRYSRLETTGSHNESYILSGVAECVPRFGPRLRSFRRSVEWKASKNPPIRHGQLTKEKYSAMKTRRGRLVSSRVLALPHHGRKQISNVDACYVQVCFVLLQEQNGLTNGPIGNSSSSPYNAK